jgi:hypothetical protein
VHYAVSMGITLTIVSKLLTIRKWRSLWMHRDPLPFRVPHKIHKNYFNPKQQRFYKTHSPIKEWSPHNNKWNPLCSIWINTLTQDNINLEILYITIVSSQQRGGSSSKLASVNTPCLSILVRPLWKHHNYQQVNLWWSRVLVVTPPWVPRAHLRKNIHNPHARATHSYSLVEYLVQSPATMFVLEVFQTYPSQIKSLLSTLGEIDPTNPHLINFDLDNLEPLLHSSIAFQISVT